MNLSSVALRTTSIATLICGLVLVSGGGGAETSNPSLDNQRRAAQALVQDGRYPEAIDLLSSIVANATAGPMDYLMLAKVQEKLDRRADASASYRHVLSLTPRSPSLEEQRRERKEALSRLRVLDPESPRVDEAVDGFLKKLDALVADAEQASNHDSLDRLLAIRSAVLVADAREQIVSVAVPADSLWVSTGLKVTAGRRYNLTAGGRWHVGAGNVQCGAGGRRDVEPNHSGRVGQLLGAVDQGEPFMPLGVDVSFVAPSSGVLFLGSNDQKKPGNDLGTLEVMIEPQ